MPFILSIRVVQRFQTVATFLKRAFKVVVFSCLVQNSISRVENLLSTIEGITLNYHCNMAKQAAVIYLYFKIRIGTFEQILIFLERRQYVLFFPASAGMQLESSGPIFNYA